MLPAETFAEVISFLAYYDLGGLKLSNGLSSAVAQQCADAIRLFDFSAFSFLIHDTQVEVLRLCSDGSALLVCRLELVSEKNVIEFIIQALRNCTVGCLALVRRFEHVLHAISMVADTVTVDNLRVTVEAFTTAQQLIQFLDSFRRVQVCSIAPVME